MRCDLQADAHYERANNFSFQYAYGVAWFLSRPSFPDRPGSRDLVGQEDDVRLYVVFALPMGIVPGLDHAHGKSASREPAGKAIVVPRQPDREQAFGPQGVSRRKKAGSGIKPIVAASGQTFGTVVDIEQDAVVSSARSLYQHKPNSDPIPPGRRHALEDPFTHVTRRCVRSVDQLKIRVAVLQS